MKSIRLCACLLFALIITTENIAQSSSLPINQKGIYVGVGSNTIRGIEIGQNGTIKYPRERDGDIQFLIEVFQAIFYIATWGSYDPFQEQPVFWHTIKKSPAIQVGYQFKENEHWAFSTLMTYQHIHQSFRFEDENIPDYNINTHYLSAMARADKYWTKDANNRFYSGIAVGLSLDKKNPIAHQVCIIGTRFGSEHAKAFVELGAGYNGIISAGLSANW